MEWVELQQIFMKKKLLFTTKEPEDKFRAYCYNLCKKSYIQIIGALLLLGNLILFFCSYSGESEEYKLITSLLNLIFLFFFHLEILSYTSAYGMAIFRYTSIM